LCGKYEKKDEHLAYAELQAIRKTTTNAMRLVESYPNGVPERKHAIIATIKTESKKLEEQAVQHAKKTQQVFQNKLKFAKHSSNKKSILIVKCVTRNSS